MAAKLHDVGKMITPLHVMNNADRLSDRLPIMEMRFKLIEQILKTEAAGGQIDKSKFEEELAGLNDNIEFIRKVNTAGFLPDDMLERVNSLEGISYGDGEDKINLVTADELDMLRIRKGTLSAEERHIIEQHVEYTDKILSQITFGDKYKRVKFIAAAHHEYLDGSGYPKGLKANKLSREQCILQVADVVTALTCERSYREKLSSQEVIKILKQEVKDGRLNRQITDCFIDSYDEITGMAEKEAGEALNIYRSLTSKYQSVYGDFKNKNN